MYYEPSYLRHHGIKGMKWGVRRFQTKSGGLTPAGRKRYNGDGPVKTALKKRYGLKDDAWERDEVEGRHNPKHMAKETKANKAKRESELRKEYGKLEDQMTYGKNADTKKNAALQKRMDEIDNELNSKSERKGLSDKQKKALKVGAAVAGTALAAYGAYKFNQYVKTKNCEIAAKKGYDYAEDLHNMRVDRFLSRDKTMYTSFTSESNAGNAAKAAYDEARNDNFRTAARNVRNYRKEGGTLKNLASRGDYNQMHGSSYRWADYSKMTPDEIKKYRNSRY